MIMWHRKASVENAIRLFLELYDDAKKNKIVQKPISYALYHTWQYFDTIEKARKT